MAVIKHSLLPKEDIRHPALVGSQQVAFPESFRQKCFQQGAVQPIVLRTWGPAWVDDKTSFLELCSMGTCEWASERPFRLGQDYVVQNFCMIENDSDIGRCGVNCRICSKRSELP